MTDQPEPYRYVDEDGFCLSARLLPNLNTGGLTDVLSISVEGDGEPQSAHVPAAKVEEVVAAIRTAAGQPHDRAALRDRIADAIRDAACPGDCDKTEAECTKERIQPCVWHHGRLAAVEGAPEQFADAVLAVLPEPDDRAAVLREAAAFVGNDDDCGCGGCDTCIPRALAAGLLDMADEAQQPTAGEQPDTRRERQRKYDKAVDARLPKLKGWNPIDRNLAGLGITDAVMVVADEEQQEMANATVAFTAAIRRQNDNLRTMYDVSERRVHDLIEERDRLRAELEQARTTTLTEAADVAKAEGDRLHDDAGLKAAEAAWGVGALLRDLAAARPGVQAEDGAQQQ
ncbi:hypothetical protein CU044_2117 [Streptomyces sp. L-9-10]|uniref:hypothetical protein n=1 Tax=Streptomyces sp. L-9-10 TaxID=1478131 RepID=UPI00101C006C|nr:hypothetical protein [Streptomyces sp. L-9-10]RYJ29376.1 hypothetical protein CU044_2117 [Streptomyces sp. L-9-10]